MIVQAAKALETPFASHAHTAAALPVDRNLARTIHEVLHCELAHAV